MSLSGNSISRVITSFLCVILISCSSSENLNIERGTNYNFKVGYPEFRISIFGFVDQDKGPTLRITAELVKGSFVYKSSPNSDSLLAKFALDFQVEDLDKSEVVISKRDTKTITSKDQNVTTTRESLTMEYPLEVAPSRYKVTISVTDLISNKTITQTEETFIPETETGGYTLSKIQMFGKVDTNAWEPVTTYDVKSKIDSLRFVAQIISQQTDTPLLINSRLLRFKSDTSSARPMHFPNYSPSSIEYKGINFDEKTEIQSTKRKLTSYGNIFIEYKFPMQERGTYRFEVTAKKQKEEKIYKARAFGVKSKNYPSLKTPRELARPLIYLMGKKEHEDLMAISNSDSLKKEIDRFWLKNIGNASKAKDIIRMYYQRVEEANKQFSNFKEGWKTDFGMVYILFGSPWYIENRLKEVIWYFTYNREDPEYSYSFYQPKLKNRYFPFYHFLLQRHSYYYTAQYLQRDLWLSGQILTRRL